MDRDAPRKREGEKMGNEGRKRNQNRSRGDKRDIFADPSKSSSLCTIRHYLGHRSNFQEGDNIFYSGKTIPKWSRLWRAKKEVKVILVSTV